MFEPPLPPPLELLELPEPLRYDPLVIPENAPALTFAIEPDTELVSPLELRLLRLVRLLPMPPKPEVKPLRLSPDIDVFDIRPCKLLNCPPPKAEVKPPVILEVKPEVTPLIALVKPDVIPDVIPLSAPVTLDVNPDVMLPSPRTLN